MHKLFQAFNDLVALQNQRDLIQELEPASIFFLGSRSLTTFKYNPRAALLSRYNLFARGALHGYRSDSRLITRFSS